MTRRRSISRDSQLDAREQAFVDALLSGNNRTQAAIIAGYPKKSARQGQNRLMKRPRIIAALAGKTIPCMLKGAASRKPNRTNGDVLLETREAVVAELGKQADLTSDWVVNRLMRNAEAAFEHKNFPASNKALETLARYLGILNNEDDEDKRALQDHVPLEARLALYTQREMDAQIDGAENVERMPARGPGAGGNGAA